MGINLERQHVLTKKEKNVMRVIYQAADKKNGVCLISPIEIFEKLPLDIEYEEEELDTIMSNLAIDDYFDLTRSDKKVNWFTASICDKKVLPLPVLRGHSNPTSLSVFCWLLLAVFAQHWRQQGSNILSNISSPNKRQSVAKLN